ncbi:hypothetical protein Goarm_019206 [Gossypium armourianum]|uniref:Uncharacterized protein n=1 Tax=Gossypium armourianum TaxID=34283 RepID=A0A7J9IJU5_9ROSI|nr:hypothetical protein [Gossypium armourianum]
MSPHKFKDYSMVKMDIDVCVANVTVVASIFDMNTLQGDSIVRHGVENIGIIVRMSEDTQSREGDSQIASFDSSLPQIVRMDCRRNHKDKLKGIWQSWD